MSVDEIKQKYCFVLVRKPHEIMHEREVGNLFSKIVSLKTIGYQKEYGPNVLPFDSSDFVASHLLLCEKDGLTPVLGFKSVTLKVCDEYRIPFPMLGMLESKNDTTLHKLIVSKMIENYRAMKKEDQFAYNGSFTIHPELRKKKELMKSLWDITFSLLTNYYIDYEINHVIAICSKTFKVDEKKKQLGWNYIESQGQILNEYLCEHLFDTSFVPMELKNVKKCSTEASSKFQDMWKDRITYDFEYFNKTKKEAA